MCEGARHEQRDVARCFRDASCVRSEKVPCGMDVMKLELIVLAWVCATGGRHAGECVVGTEMISALRDQ